MPPLGPPRGRPVRLAACDPFTTLLGFLIWRRRARAHRVCRCGCGAWSRPWSCSAASARPSATRSSARFLACRPRTTTRQRPGPTRSDPAGSRSSVGPFGAPTRGPARGRRLAPMPIASLFEIGARVLRRHARLLLAVAILIQLPGAILDAIAQQRLADVGQSPARRTGHRLRHRCWRRPTARRRVILGAAAAGGRGDAAVDGPGRHRHGRLRDRGVARLSRGAVEPRRAAPPRASGAPSRRWRRPSSRRWRWSRVIAATVALAIGCVLLLPTGAGEAGGLGVFLALVVGVAGAVAGADPARPAVSRDHRGRRGGHRSRHRRSAAAGTSRATTPGGRSAVLVLAGVHHLGSSHRCWPSSWASPISDTIGASWASPRPSTWLIARGPSRCCSRP